MWELDSKESWVPKNWCFWTVVLEKTLESHLDYKEIQPVQPKGDQSWVFTGRTDVEAETPILATWGEELTVEKDPDAGKDWGQEEKGMTEDEMVGWHHRQYGHEFEQALGVGDGRGAWCAAVHGVAKESDMTEQLNWTERRTMPKNVQTTAQLLSFHMLARLCSKSFKLGFSSTCTENFQMYSWFRKSRGTSDQIANIHWIMEKAREFQKTSTFTSWTSKAFYCVDHNKL